MNSCDKQQLKITAAKVRLGIIEGVYNAKSGHPGGSLSAADIFTYLYFKELHIDPQNPKDPDRDRFVLSKGHCAPGLYAALAQRGYFSVDELKTKGKVSKSVLDLLEKNGALRGMSKTNQISMFM